MADRSTAAVGVANEGGATSDGTTTDDQTSTPSDGTDTAGATRNAPERAAEPSADESDKPEEREEPDKSEEPEEKEREPEPVEETVRLTEAVGAAEPDAATEPLSVEPPAAAATTVAQAADEVPRDPGAQAAGARSEPAPDAPSPAPVNAGAGSGGRTDADTVPMVGAVARRSTASASTAASTTGTTAAKRRPKPPTTAPDLHSGHKLARRYQLEECVTRVDGFSSWRAVDEKLRRAVGIHVLPADHGRARQVLAAARSAALLGDPRFVQVLDAVEDNELVYVIHEWLPDATPLADLLATGPLEPHEAYQMVSQVSQGMAAAHREGLAHLRLDPGDVLRTMSGQYRIRGLAVAAALRGLSSDRPQRQDTESIGALLYASLTQRWPYEEDAHGLSGLPKGVGLVAPDQVRAGVHRGLSEIAMRALVNDGATASREEPPCTTPEELAKAVAAVPRIRPPEQPAPVYRPTPFAPSTPPPGAPGRTAVAAPAPPPALPGRTGQALKWAVAALLIVAIGLGSWQLADTLQSRENQPTKRATPTGQRGGKDATHPATGKPLPIATVKDFDPLGNGTENPTDVSKAYDNDPSTYWETSWYASADLGSLKPGVGLIVDLGSARAVSQVKVNLIGSTDVQLMAAPGSSATPTRLNAFTKVATGSGTNLTLTLPSKVTSRYLLVWLTKLPPAADGSYRGKISEIHVVG
nr:protein kinase family protein [Streptomyces sp. HPF1205]